MNTRTVLIATVVGLLLIVSIDAAKPGKVGKGKSAEKIKADKVKAAEMAADPAMGEVVVLEEPAVIGGLPTPKIYRPKHLKVVTAYDKCKADCKKIVDQQDLASYAMQLREELAAAEAALEAAEPAAEEDPAV